MRRSLPWPRFVDIVHFYRETYSERNAHVNLIVVSSSIRPFGTDGAYLTAHVTSLSMMCDPFFESIRKNSTDGDLLFISLLQIFHLRVLKEPRSVHRTFLVSSSNRRFHRPSTLRSESRLFEQRHLSRGDPKPSDAKVGVAVKVLFRSRSRSPWGSADLPRLINRRSETAREKR